jgi:translation initiation factor 4E
MDSPQKPSQEGKNPEMQTPPETSQSTSSGEHTEPQPTTEPDASKAIAGTVFADPTNFTIKHPLQNRWTLWYDNPRKKTSQDTWGNYLKKIVDVDTVEDFWRLYNNIVPASQLEHGSNYHLFKTGIEPKWEDPANGKGGQWTITLPPKMRKDVDQLWLFTLLACIGETFGDEEDEICGCVVSLRKPGDRIAIWTRTASKEATTRAIGAQFRRTLDLPPNIVLGYQCHADSMRRSGSQAPKNRYEA